ncbi:MAG: SPOR domain-containing protein [Moraxella sp.]|nr:SPOR domain-containing protein [Moraxella sp.]
MISKQALLSISLIVGGGVAVYALNHNSTPAAPDAPKTPTATTSDSDTARPTVEPLTADIKTEQQILSQQQKAREARTLAQEKQAQALIEDQERAKALALQKAQIEADAIAKAKSAKQAQLEETTATNLTVQTRPEAAAILHEQAKQHAPEKSPTQPKAQPPVATNKSDGKAQKTTHGEKTDHKKVGKEKEAIKAKTEPKNQHNTAQKTKAGQHTVVRGDTLIKLSHQYGVPVSIIAKANNMGRNDALPAGKTIKIPSKSEIAKIQQELHKADKKETAKKETNKSDTSKKGVAKDNAQKDSAKKEKSGVRSVPTHYSVQVAMADSQEKANALAKQYRAAGYRVVTSRTSKGVRVLVGSEKTAEAANALKSKIAKDSRVKTDGAWVKQVDTINP